MWPYTARLIGPVGLPRSVLGCHVRLRSVCRRGNTPLAPASALGLEPRTQRSLVQIASAHVELPLLGQPDDIPVGQGTVRRVADGAVGQILSARRRDAYAAGQQRR